MSIPDRLGSIVKRIERACNKIGIQIGTERIGKYTVQIYKNKEGTEGESIPAPLLILYPNFYVDAEPNMFVMPRPTGLVKVVDALANSYVFHHCGCENESDKFKAMGWEILSYVKKYGWRKHFGGKGYDQFKRLRSETIITSSS